MAAMMAAVAVAAGVVGFELTVWWEAKAVVPGAFSSDDGEKVVWDWLIQEHVVSKEALIGLAMGMLPPEWPLGQKLALLTLVADLRQGEDGPPAAKRARGDGNTGETPVNATVKAKFVVFLDGQRLPTNSSDRMADRALGGQFSVRATDDDTRYRVLGLAPYFDNPLEAVQLKQVAVEVISDLAAGMVKTAATESRQTWWGLGFLSTMLQARVWKDAAVLGRLLRGEWEKYKMRPLSLIDFYRGGPFEVKGDVLTDYAFLSVMVEALKSWAAMMSAVFSDCFAGMADGIVGRLEESQFGLAHCSQRRLLTQLNDAVADGFDDARRAYRGPTGGDIKKPGEVRALFVHYLQGVVLSTGENGPAGNDNFKRLRQDLYDFGAPTEGKGGKAPPAPGIGGGGAKEAAGGKGVGRGTLCVDFLREALGLRVQSGLDSHGRRLPNTAGTGALVRCATPRCKLEHVRLCEQTRAGLVARLRAEGVDLEKTGSYGAKIKEALDGCTLLKK